MRLTPLALAAAAAGLSIGGGDAGAQSSGPPLEPARKLQAAPRGDAGRQLPIILRADRLSGRPDLEALAEGDVDFRRGGLVIGADRLHYDVPTDRASARGHVRIERDGARYAGEQLELAVQRFEGFFLAPTFEFEQLGAGGRADRIDFLDTSRAVAINARYTSCPRDGSGDPDWVLETDRVRMDFEANEGVAEGAVLRFLGAPILALPTLTFPLSDARKSGWLPPGVDVDNKSGLDLSLPYYWNIAPNRDATIVPRLITRRGFGVDAEFRYLEASDEGALDVTYLPNDRVADRSRESLHWKHEGTAGGGLYYALQAVRVSDDAWWKDFPDGARSLAPRLLPARALVERPFGLAGGEGLMYARAQRWQVLQGSDALVTAPYQRAPQLGVQWRGAGGGLEFALETELNRFTLPADESAVGRLTGNRAHALGSVAWPFREPGWWVVPRLSFNAASYRLDTADSEGRRNRSRVIPTASMDLGLEFERRTEGFGRGLVQTLEPRFLYVNTPYESQAAYPVFDTAAKDFNFASIYSENAFSGVDRVSDAHQVTAGVTTRLVDEVDGAEVLRLGLVQRLLLRDQRVTAKADGSPDGDPLEQRFSDVLLLGSTSAIPQWTLDAAVQYSPDIQRSVRSILGARWSPGPFRTVSATYRFARGLSEQVELGWQWPVYARAAPAAGGCGGTLYTVGRVNYSMKDSRVTDSILGVEYDTGCWIGRFVAKRLSTGASEATTRLMLQLELVGLSRLGSNPLKVLKDNIPGYRLLREDRRSPNPAQE